MGGMSDDKLLPGIPGEPRFLLPSQLTFVGDEDFLTVGRSLGMTEAMGAEPVYDPNVPLVVAVSSTSSIRTFYKILEHRQKREVLAVIAWRLPEEHLEALYVSGVPIIVGQPTVETLMDTVNHPPDLQRRAADRAFAADVAVLESIFEQPRA